MFRSVTFELSLKPFKDASEATMDTVCRRLFRQWLALRPQAESLAVMLWTADGSEILDYQGRLEATFEWSKWQGVANPHAAFTGKDPSRASVHQIPRLYLPEPPEFTYAWLQRLVARLKAVGAEISGLPVRVGATFDPGPEFAVSSFKYARHPEICMGDTMGKGSMVCCYATLAADQRPYAGFPAGIPEGTAFGTFLGRQAQHFLTDLGFDFLWLSNGFGFGLETWGLQGALFDGRRFAAGRTAEVREKSLRFWRSFRAECPDFPLETRGTNLSTGMDLSSDAVPLREIYDTVPHLLPPPNSPWAALNGDFGLELVGWMSHIAEIPGAHFPFRFYIHDPWFLNSPWLDRYQREPHDIYLPLSVSRLDAAGRVQVPTELKLLTADDSWGDMPDQVPNEVIPHLLAARAVAPDAAGPLLWVYPFDEYHAMTFGTPSRLEEVFFGDWFMRGAVNYGLPLNTVISTRNAVALLQREPTALAESILVTPVPDAGSDWDTVLSAAVGRGVRVLVYGPLTRAGDWLRTALGLALAEPLEGEFEICVQPGGDGCDYAAVLRHHGLFSAGGLGEVVGGAAGSPPLATARQGTAERVVAVTAAPAAGALVWVRGTVSCDPQRVGGHLLVPYDAAQAFPAEALMRRALAGFGWEVIHDKASPSQPGPMLCISRHRNGFFLAGYSPDSTVATQLRMPQGIPLLSGLDTWISGGRARYALPGAWFRECRVFIDQEDGGPVSCRVRYSGFPTIRRRLEITGLRAARVRFFYEPGTAAGVELTRNAAVPCLGAEGVAAEVVTDRLGAYLQTAAVTGQLMISW
jgi:hypothetical protein